MEVHHPHHPTHKKKWSEYFLEFFMLFFAVTLGFFAENIREHQTEHEKTIKSLQNLYAEVKDDSIKYDRSIKRRRLQDSFFEYVYDKYEKNEIKSHIPEFYAAHQYMVLRAYPNFNSNTLDQIKNNGLITFIEDDSLKLLIQNYSQNIKELYIRQNREFGFMDRMIDPITSKYFFYKYYGLLNEETQKIEKGEVELLINIPRTIKLNKEEDFDWNSYITIMGELKTIKQSSEFYYLAPTQKNCHLLLKKIREYLGKNI